MSVTDTASMSSHWLIILNTANGCEVKSQYLNAKHVHNFVLF